MTAAGGLPFLMYALGHAAIGAWQGARQWRLRGQAGAFVRCGNCFFCTALVCNNAQLFAGALATPGTASKNLFYVEDSVHLLVLPLYVLMASDVLNRALDSDPVARNSKFARTVDRVKLCWLARLVTLAALAFGLDAEITADFGAMRIDRDALGVESWSTASDSAPTGVVIIALWCVGVGAVLWRTSGYATLFWFQLLDLVGQAAAGAGKKAGYLGLVSNAFEVTFTLSTSLAEARFFEPAADDDHEMIARVV